MDTFIDKLAQRFTAQEMIKANAAADAEELKRLEAQVKEYQECLKRMEHICQLVEDTAEEACRQMEETANEACKQLEKTAEEAEARLEAAAIDGEDIDRMVEAGLTKIRQIQSDGEKLEGLRRQLEEIRAQQCTVEDMSDVTRAVDDVNRAMDNVNHSVEDVNQAVSDVTQAVGDVTQAMGDVNREIQEINQKLQNMPQEDKISAALEEKLEASGDAIHKECVKVYRNVQAVISEENTKQTDSVNEFGKGFTKKLTGVMGISIAALVFSLAGVVFQVLTWLHVL